MNGSEPVRPSTYRRFLDRFAPYGLSPEANVAAYGLVENTLAVSSYGRRALAVDRRSLQKRRVEIVRDDAPAARRLELMSCGRHLDGVHVRIVDPETGAAVDGDKIGEVWVAGPSKCQGYWNRPELSDQVFRNSIGNDPDDEHSYLRTGDLGFLEGGEIFVCGRLKDVIILRGRNYYAEDLERAVELVSDRVRAGLVVAVRGQEDEDGLVVVVGVKRSDDLPDPGEVTRALRSHEYDGRHTIVFVRHQVIARTTSGKLARSRTREEWLDGTIAAIETHVNGSDGEALDDERELGLMSRYEQILNSYSLSGDEVQTLSEVGCICVCQAPSRSAPSVAGSCAQPADVLLQRQGCRASLRDGLRPPLTPEPLHARWGSVRGRQVPAPASRAAHSYVRRWCRGCSGSSLIGEHDAPQVCGDAPLEAAQRLAAGLALIDLATEVGMPFGVGHPDLGDGDEVQGGVELAVPGTGQPVAGMFRAGDLDRSGAGVAGVVRDPDGNRDAVPVRPSTRAASTGPTPSTLHSRLPEDATTSRMRCSLCFKRASTPRSSVIISRARSLRVRSTVPAGRIGRSRAAAWSAVSLVGAPPGSRSRSSACSWLTSRVRCAARLTRRSSSNAKTAVVSSSAMTDVASPCNAATLAAAAAITSFFRRPPRESSRTRVVAVAGTSWTRSPRTSSHCARCRPRPRAFSTAHVRSGHCLAQASNRR